jgi:preprotein translocase subunit SecD
MRPIFQSLLLLSLTLFAFLPAHAGHKPPQIFLRIHVQTAGEGLPTSQAVSIAVPPNGEIIQIRAIPEVSEHDLVDVKTDARGSVFLFLNHRGKVNLDAATGENQGKILVVMLNGYVIYAPTIDEQITNGVFVIPHPLAPQVIQLLQETAKKNVADAPPKPY